jgi:hypothetical protein
LYVTASYATTGFSLLFQGKRIDNMSYRSDRTATIQNLLINYLPATTKQHSYTMLAMNPYATQLKGEIGFMAELQYKVKKGTPLGGKYGMEITLNYSQAHGLKKYADNDSTTALILINITTIFLLRSIKNSIKNSKALLFMPTSSMTAILYRLVQRMQDMKTCMQIFLWWILLISINRQARSVSRSRVCLPLTRKWKPMPAALPPVTGQQL